VCTEQASKGNFAVPVSILNQLPAVANDVTAGSIGMIGVMAVPDPAKNQGRFTAPLTAGGNLDQGLFSYAIGAMKNTGWQ
jgi:hypothetical protein